MCLLRSGKPSVQLRHSTFELASKIAGLRDKRLEAEWSNSTRILHRDLLNFRASDSRFGPQQVKILGKHQQIPYTSKGASYCTDCGPCAELNGGGQSGANSAKQMTSMASTSIVWFFFSAATVLGRAAVETTVKTWGFSLQVLLNKSKARHWWQRLDVDRLAWQQARQRRRAWRGVDSLTFFLGGSNNIWAWLTVSIHINSTATIIFFFKYIYIFFFF